MNDVYRAPREQSDLEQLVSYADLWHDKILTGSRTQEPSFSERLYPSMVSDIVSRMAARSLSALHIKTPLSQEFKEAVSGLKESVYAMSEFDSAGPQVQRTIRDIEVSSDVNDPVGTSNVVDLLEINSAFQNSEVSTNAALRPRIEDGGMHACTIFRELLLANATTLETILSDQKISDEISYLVAKTHQLQQE